MKRIWIVLLLGVGSFVSVHANCLNAKDTPISTIVSAFPAGTIFVCNAPYTGPGTVYPLSIVL